jgi:hypothetical protein
VIDFGRVDDGLYLLEVGFVGLGNTSEFKHGLVTIFKEVNQELLLWHNRMRHSSFVVPRKIFPEHYLSNLLQKPYIVMRVN